jgi:four helix bundle protein
VPDTRPPAANFRDLIVWRKAHEFALAIYKLTGAFPPRETYGLASQMRRAAVSAAANVAEGFGKRGKADKARFMNIAQGSIEESRYYLILTKDLGYAETDGLMSLLEEVSRMLNSYCRAIRAS